MAEKPAAETRSLYQVVQDGIDAARSKIEDVRGTLKDFDAKQQASSAMESASTYLAATIDRAQEALGDLSRTTQTWKENATEVPVRALSGAFARVNEALTELRDLAKTYDEKYKLSSTVSAAIADPQHQASVALAAAASCAANASAAATAQLQGVSDGLKVRIMNAAELGLQKALPAAVAADERLSLTAKVTVAHDVVTQRVKEFNETYAVADRLKEVDERFSLTQYCTSALGAAQGLDQRVTGGKLEPAVLSAYDMGLQMVGYVIAKYEEAKKKEDETKVDTAKEVPKKEAPREKEAKQAPEVAAPETATA
jgi:hypothetical protein|uniref:Uncharacterized protein n=1 Tax=Eutreptiella gymnastica TaxID=73025 RepID=A0A7S4GAS6_9EUGL|eukprot:CAMPEP_0174286366 /NCGR_PEP_ID=MMETSP0809-20121228/11584_1 /TAXON_ID=73025 ORGANISM="Eutreptiella gymnastica-like, Strain CCMP1594" /NCGR_SAMPLE_ID=MMETSP0809 /ASSEMBLY_ACC=CAM_ASM_000658 /LENGTH=311 /DNA_ID=CAMNT_0015382399 /DNA_START=26 /DNA_END=961 /DNA_ORIENTATION=-